MASKSTDRQLRIALDGLRSYESYGRAITGTIPRQSPSLDFIAARKQMHVSPKCADETFGSLITREVRHAFPTHPVHETC